MKKKEIKEIMETIEKLNSRINEVERNFGAYKDFVVIREWLLKTNFVGNLKDKNLIKQLKENPLKLEKYFEDEGINPAFEDFQEDCQSERISMSEAFKKLGNQLHDIAGALTQPKTDSYETICEQIKSYNFKNLKKFYERIVELERLQTLLDEQRPIDKPKKATSATKTGSSNIKNKKEKNNE